MAQSSVEWLASKVQKHFYITDKDALYPIFQEWVNQAKATHKEEHEDAYIEGGNCISHGWAWTIEGRKDMASIHYNETYGDGKETK